MVEPKINTVTYTTYTISTTVQEAMWGSAFLWQQIDQETIFQSILDRNPQAASSSMLIECNDLHQAKRIVAGINEGRENAIKVTQRNGR